MIARANGLLQHEEISPVGGVSTSLANSTYPREVITPQNRHDNGKLDITKIRILPTENEIRTDRAGFLRSTDVNQPHFLTDQLERHLGTHFRLYCHDYLGEVNEALGGAMHAIENDPMVLEDTRITLIGKATSNND